MVGGGKTSGFGRVRERLSVEEARSTSRRLCFAVVGISVPSVLSPSRVRRVFSSPSFGSLFFSRWCREKERADEGARETRAKERCVSG